MTARLLARRVDTEAIVLGPHAKIVRGKFVVNVGTNGEASLLAGLCHGAALTDRPERCEAIAATVIVIPHVGVTLPPGTSLDLFLADVDALFRAPDVRELIRRGGGL